MGRKPAPASLRLLNGRSPGRDSGGREVPDGPAFVRDAPAKPADLSPDADLLWDSIVPALVRLNLLKDADSASVTACCEAYSRWREAVRTRRHKGLLANTSHGTSVGPWVRVEENASREFRAWCSEFGLTPASEAKLVRPRAPESENNPFADFQFESSDGA